MVCRAIKDDVSDHTEKAPPIWGLYLCTGEGFLSFIAGDPLDLKLFRRNSILF
jgi:hypothetical protein